MGLVCVSPVLGLRDVCGGGGGGGSVLKASLSLLLKISGLGETFLPCAYF